MSFCVTKLFPRSVVSPLCLKFLVLRNDLCWYDYFSQFYCLHNIIFVVVIASSVITTFGSFLVLQDDIPYSYQLCYCYGWSILLRVAKSTWSGDVGLFFVVSSRKSFYRSFDSPLSQSRRSMESFYLLLLAL